MYYLTILVNHPDDTESEWIERCATIADVNDTIHRIVYINPSATSFVFTIIPSKDNVHDR